MAHLKAERLKKEGHWLMREDDNHRTAEKYTEALSIRTEDNELSAALFWWRAVAHDRLHQYSDALNDCDSSIELRASNAV